MAVSVAQIVKTLPVPVRKRSEDGKVVDDTLEIEYRPVTKAWLDKWEEIRLKEQAVAQASFALLAERMAARAALEGAKEEDRAELQSKLEDVERRAREHREANPEPEYDFLTRQMADLLVDVGYVGEDGKPLPVTEENLANVVDRELLVEISERIEKKLSRGSKT